MDLRDAGEIIEQVGACNVLPVDRKSTRLNSSHSQISYAVFCLKKKTVDLQVRNADGEVFFELTMQAAWVWDMYRPARFVKNVRGVTFKDVIVEKLAKAGLCTP